jgi:hypothetical protein
VSIVKKVFWVRSIARVAIAMIGATKTSRKKYDKQQRAYNGWHRFWNIELRGVFAKWQDGRNSSATGGQRVIDAVRDVHHSQGHCNQGDTTN